MRAPQCRNDGIHTWFLGRKVKIGNHFIDLLEYTEATEPTARFMAIAHRGYPTLFNVSLLGQASTAMAALIECRTKLRGLEAEAVQETPHGTWLPIEPSVFRRGLN